MLIQSTIRRRRRGSGQSLLLALKRPHTRPSSAKLTRSTTLASSVATHTVVVAGSGQDPTQRISSSSGVLHQSTFGSVSSFSPRRANHSSSDTDHATASTSQRRMSLPVSADESTKTTTPKTTTTTITNGKPNTVVQADSNDGDSDMEAGDIRRALHPLLFPYVHAVVCMRSLSSVLLSTSPIVHLYRSVHQRKL